MGLDKQFDKISTRRSRIGLRKTFGHSETSDLSADLSTEDRLEAFMKKFDVNTDIWPPKLRQKWLAELAREVERGSCFLTKGPGGVERSINVVRIRLWSPSKQFLLVEVGRKHRTTGVVNWKAQMP